jgi:hypothetical protein
LPGTKRPLQWAQGGVSSVTALHGSQNKDPGYAEG